MRFEYDPWFVEQATFLAARQDAAKECALHEAIDALYRVSDAELRQRLFRERYGDLFGRFGLDRIVPAHVHTFRLIAERLDRGIIREAERASAESVDLYREKLRGEADLGRHVMIIALRPDALLEPGRLGPWLYRQLQHVEDMLDERFAYQPRLPSVPPMQRNVLRDRYAALWDIDVEARLVRRGRIPGDNADRLRSAFCRAFSCDSPRAHEVFERLWTIEGLTHPQILAWAAEPRRLFEGEGEHVCRDNEVSGMA